MTDETAAAVPQEPGVIVPVPAPKAWDEQFLDELETTLVRRVREDIDHYEAGGRKVTKLALQELLGIRETFIRRRTRSIVLWAVWDWIVCAVKRVLSWFTAFGKMVASWFRRRDL